jgi:tRNA threonylcarbamoyladenosine biosynthesis protein TsaB
MRVLALDTTTRGGSVALVENGRVVDEITGDASRTHAERLPAEILALLDAHRLAVGDVDVFAVASGPGSFTGLRIGIATIQGLAFVHRRKIAAVGALDALAHAVARDAAAGTRIAAWMDAHRREVFAARYEVGTAPPFEPARLVELEGPTVGDPAATLDRWRSAPPADVFAGDGAALYAEIIARALPSARVIGAPPLAGAIGCVAVARARRGELVDPAGVHPVYVRRPDAELAKDHALADRNAGVPRRD